MSVRIGHVGLAFTAAMVALVTAPASALVINLNDVGGVTGSQADKGFRIAAKYWESVLTSNATVNINVGFDDLGPGVLGGTGTRLEEYVPIDTYKTLLAGASSGNGVDTLATSHLPATLNGSIAVTVPGYINAANKTGVADDGSSRLAPAGEAISSTMAIAGSNLKALMNDASFKATDTDAGIYFSNTFNFDFDPSDGVAAGSYDFIGVAVHEMGHALGFLSGVQDFDYSTGDDSFTPDTAWWGYASDMFRYSAPGKLDWTFGTNSYFSLDGGVTPFQDGYWSTGAVNGDGWQASHWQQPAGGGCANFRGIMNPYICSGLTDSVSSLDIAMLDSIGWNTNVDAVAQPTYRYTTAQMYNAFAAEVPEPAIWVQMVFGFGLAGSLVRHRRTIRAKAIAA